MLILLAALASCSVEKNTNLSRFYHNLTSHYNIYFNAKESYLKGMERISASNTDDYTVIMPLFEFSNPDAVRSASSDMDRAMQKASKVISLHSMTAKPEKKGNNNLSDREKELYDRNNYNNWVDDSYLLLGKAQHMKHDFENARVTFLHNIRESDSRLMRIESQIWLARSVAELNKPIEALRLLSEIENQEMTESLMAELLLSRADIYIKDKRYEDASIPLKQALELMKGNSPKNRYTYILARIYEETGNSVNAENTYREVLKLSPPYELEFNARINQAGVFDVESGDADEIEKELKRLLKDIKNKEYQDQIYYALGNLSMREGDVEQAIEYIQLSASVSSTNMNQKGLSYLMLAEHFFGEKEYLKAQVYYDSTVSFLETDYPGYNEINETALNLKSLAENLNVINRQDSLQYVASLPEAQQQSLINGIIRKIEEEERIEEAEVDDRYNMGQFYENQRRFRDNVDQSGKWYFYNQAALTFGRTEFRNRWGQRKLEDNWRRRNKASVNSMGLTEDGEQVQADTMPALMNIKSPEYYLKDLPVNDSLLAISDDKIATSLFDAGRIFDEKFDNREKSNELYNELVNRYPDNILVAQALYNLYNLNMESDPGLAEQNKSLLLNRYPDSEFARIVSNPEYFDILKQEKQAEENLYNNAYNYWVNEDFNKAIEICEEGIAKYPDGELLPKFYLLKAYCMARSVDERTLKEELQALAKKFPGTIEATRASELVAHINRELPELKVEEEKEIAEEIYSTELSGPHYFVVILKSNELDVNRLTFDVINFNIDTYTNKNYSTRGELVNDKYIMITVRTLEDEFEAADYYNSFDYTGILKDTGTTEILIFTITEANMEVFLKDKDPDRYNFFFEKHYLNSEE